MILKNPTPDPKVYRFDESAAQRVIDFLHYHCRHVKGEWAGKPLDLEGWQEEIVRQAFGWKRADGTRLYRRAYVEIPKKSGKSTMGSGIGLYLLCGDGEPGAEVYSLASDKSQAGIVFEPAKLMARTGEFLARDCRVYTSSIVYKGSSFYKVLSADVKAKHGLNWHGLIMDELHTQPNRDMYDTLKGGGLARRQPFFWLFTTAGWDRTSICWELHEYARKICEGLIEDSNWFVRIYQASEQEDWEDLEVWKAVNPNYGISVKPEYLEEQHRETEGSPAAQNTFRRLHLNQWTESDVRWLDMKAWDRGNQPLRPLEGRQCWGGLDLASTLDVGALVLVFPDDDGTVDLLPFFWVPRETAESRTRKEKVQYLAWVQSGHMMATEGNVIDYGFIREEVKGLPDRYELEELAADPHNATQLLVELEQEGITVLRHSQGPATMNNGTKEFERLVKSGRVRHAGHPVLRWMASNVTVSQDSSGNLKPDKKRSGEKIDGITAAVMGVGRMMLNQKPKSKYEKEGVTVL